MLQKLALGILFLWFAIGGIAHFVFVSSFAEVVPPYIPWPVAVVYISGAFELLGAVGLALAPFRRLAAWGLFALTICVTPANIYMWQNPGLFPSIPEELLGWRLVLQVGLLAMILLIAVGRKRRRRRR